MERIVWTESYHYEEKNEYMWNKKMNISNYYKYSLQNNLNNELYHCKAKNNLQMTHTIWIIINSFYKGKQKAHCISALSISSSYMPHTLSS